MLPRWLCLPLLVTALLAGSAGLRADDDGLEAWQERILRALERGRDEREDDRERGRERENGAPARQSLVAPAGGDPGARAAVAEAQRRYGGRALAVGRSRDGYRVRLLREDGRVTTVTIED
ncbi:MAG: PepSY domain-containing protein [Pseudohaliea sp.]